MKIKKIISVLVFGLFLLPNVLFAINSGNNAPGTMADDSSVGSTAWVNVNNAKVSDAVYSDAALPTGGVSHYLKATNFGFSLPSGATVIGITVNIQRKGTQIDLGVQDNKVVLVKGGSPQTVDRSVTTTWPTTEAIQTYGGSSDLWGTTWTPNGVGASTFGCAVSCKVLSGGNNDTCSVDQITMSIDYNYAGSFFRMFKNK